MKTTITTCLLLFLYVFAHAQTTSNDYYVKARAAFEKKDYKEANEVISFAYGVDSINPNLICLKSEIMMLDKQYQDAVDVINWGIKEFPKSTLLYTRRGHLMLQFQEVTQAIEDYTTSMALTTDEDVILGSYVNLASANMQHRDFETAYRHLMSAYALDSTNLGVLINLGAVADEVGKGDKTLFYLEKALKIDSTLTGVYVNIGFKYQHMEQYEKAVEYFTKALTFSEEALAYSNRSYNRMMMGDLKGAREDIDKSILLYPGNPYAYRNSALIHLANKKKKKACEDLQIAVNKGYVKMYGEDVLVLQKENCQ